MAQIGSGRDEHRVMLSRARACAARLCDLSWREFLAHRGSLLAQRNSFDLPYGVADERVAHSVVQRREYDHAPRGVAWRGNNDDRAIIVDVVAGRKSADRAAQARATQLGRVEDL